MVKKILLITALLASVIASAQKSTYNNRARAYIARYRDWAIAEQRRSGVPAAITLAQGILETEAGASELATQANNHFGIKCKREWAGETFAHDDDAPQECFRKYSSALQSYKDHSDYLKAAKRYQPCFAQNPADYKAWARELRKCGYATNPKYAPLLIKIIEDFNLQEYTYAALSAPQQPEILIASAGAPAAIVMMAEGGNGKAGEMASQQDTPADAPVYGQIVRKDGVRGFYARRGDVLLEYAIQYKVRYAKLLEINGLPDAPLAADMFVAIEKGGKVAQMIARDVSEAPVVTYVAPAKEVERRAAPATESAQMSPAPMAPTQGETAANEPAPVGATAPAAQQATESSSVTTTPAKQGNTAAEVAAEEEKPAVPQDEFSRLKVRLDKVVYAPVQKSAAPPAMQTAVSEKPTPSAPAAAVNAKTYHTVKSGETAFGIAKRYGITMKELMAMNGLNFVEAIKVGQQLRVK